LTREQKKYVGKCFLDKEDDDGVVRCVHSIYESIIKTCECEGDCDCEAENALMVYYYEVEEHNDSSDHVPEEALDCTPLDEFESFVEWCEKPN